MEKQSRSNKSKDKKRQLTSVPSQCRICQAPALHAYFGVVSCNPCKMFFKRNAEQKQNVLKCRYGGHCEVNINNRIICSYCRLAKCFSSGMQIERIRAARLRPNKKRQDERKTKDYKQITTTFLIRLDEHEEFPTLNLLEADHSILSIDQWNLISNISHSFDEYRGFVIGERYMREQTTLPLKQRFKSSSLIDFYHKLLNETQFIYKNNKDFLSLCPNDRSVLLHSTIRHTSTLSANFIHHQIGLSDRPAFYHTVELITHPNLVSATKRIHNQLNMDMITMKLFLAILTFSTASLTFYENTPPVTLTNIKQVLSIQNEYIELLWRYLVHKHSIKGAVIALSDFMRCVFALHDGLVIGKDIKWFTDKIDSIIKDTKQILNLTS